MALKAYQQPGSWLCYVQSLRQCGGYSLLTWSSIMQKKLLFVDDDLAVLSAYQRMLRQTPYQCQFAADPLVVLQEADLSDVDILFVDQRMPGLSGTQLLAALQGHYPAMKRVLFSGDTFSAKSELADSIALNTLLAKPCSKITLLNCITDLLNEP